VCNTVRGTDVSAVTRAARTASCQWIEPRTGCATVLVHVLLISVSGIVLSCLRGNKTTEGIQRQVQLEEPTS
jgi:hypothetical protein